MSSTSSGAGSESAGTIKIIGIGQSMRGDDAAGLAAVRTWMECYTTVAERPNVLAELAELPGIGLLNLLEAVQCAILVDAIRSGASPGSIRLLSAEQLDAFSSWSGSAHGWGVAETLSLGQVLEPSPIPGKLYIIGIEAGNLSMGEVLSPEVEQALPEAAEMIEQLLQQG